jgi:hypothetical protein
MIGAHKTGVALAMTSSHHEVLPSWRAGSELSSLSQELLLRAAHEAWGREKYEIRGAIRLFRGREKVVRRVCALSHPRIVKVIRLKIGAQVHEAQSRLLVVSIYCTRVRICAALFAIDDGCH